jgi:hypothetical protein
MPDTQFRPETRVKLVSSEPNSSSDSRALPEAAELHAPVYSDACNLPNLFFLRHYFYWPICLIDMAEYLWFSSSKLRSVQVFVSKLIDGCSLVFAKAIIAIVILPRKTEKHFSAYVHGVHGVLIASVHRFYKKCARWARCTPQGDGLKTIAFWCTDCDFCALLGQGVCTLDMSTLLDSKCPQNATSVHWKIEIE